MPAGNRQGPYGDGPMTGRGMGYCAGYDTPGFAAAPAGRMGGGQWFGPGFGRGRGFRGYGFGRGGLGRGFRYGVGYGWGPGPDAIAGFPAAPGDQRAVVEEEIDALSRRLDFLKRELGATASEESEKP